MQNPPSYMNVEPTGNTVFTTTSVVTPSLATNGFTGHADQMTPIREALVRPSGSSSLEWSHLLNAFLQAGRPKVYVDSPTAVVVTAELYDNEPVSVVAVNTPEPKPFDDLESVAAQANAIVAVSEAKGSSDFPSVVSCHRKKVVTVPCSGVRPTLIPLGNIRPYVEVTRSGGVANGATKTWGWIRGNFTTSLAMLSQGATPDDVGIGFGFILKVVTKILGIIVDAIDGSIVPEMRQQKTVRPYWESAVEERLNLAVRRVASDAHHPAPKRKRGKRSKNSSAKKQKKV